MTGFCQVICENYLEKYNSLEKIVLVNSTKKLNLRKKGKICWKMLPFFEIFSLHLSDPQFFWVQSLFGLTDVHFAGS